MFLSSVVWRTLIRKLVQRDQSLETKQNKKILQGSQAPCYLVGIIEKLIFVF